ncbi:hypothetical protein ACFQ3S_09085 [Mucilaginibacter terrae]|uniref:hypothetical protein n=1 Tax=Mucilaginibacter terrae TaxID=1955052 RepID=UPI00363F6827
MGRPNFEIALEPGDLHQQFIRFKELGLLIKVLAEQERKDRYPADHLYLVAVFHSKSMYGKFNPERSKYRFFQVMNLHSERRLLWDWDLMKDAVDYFCDEHLGESCQEVNRIENGKWVKWDNDVYFD